MPLPVAKLLHKLVDIAREGPPWLHRPGLAGRWQTLPPRRQVVPGCDRRGLRSGWAWQHSDPPPRKMLTVDIAPRSLHYRSIDLRTYSLCRWWHRNGPNRLRRRLNRNPWCCNSAQARSQRERRRTSADRSSSRGQRRRWCSSRLLPLEHRGMMGRPRRTSLDSEVPCLQESPHSAWPRARTRCARTLH